MFRKLFFLTLFASSYSMAENDYTWLNGNSRQKTFPLATQYFTGQFTLDTNASYSFANPKDHTLVGSTNMGRTHEIQVQQLGIGGDFNYENVRGRIMTQFGLYSTMTPRNDASPSRGQWNQADAYRYVSEAYGGYHFDVGNGINVDAGLFMSYVGLFSYYNYENWAYQMSYVSANTPWFFNGIRVQTFPSENLKIEYWLINGWQSYGMFNEMPGVGYQVAYRPDGENAWVFNGYYGEDTLNKPGRGRLHFDNSYQHKYVDNPSKALSKAAFSLTLDFGCEMGRGVECMEGRDGKPAQHFLGFMAYNRFWFNQNKFGLTLGGGAINNPGRYLVLVPAINGANATSGSSYLSQSPGDNFHAWDASVTFDYMPSEFITYRLEFIHREADTAYFAGRGGITPSGGNSGSPGSTVTDFTPDLERTENRINLALMIRL